MDEDQGNKQKHLRLVVNNEPAFRIKTPLERLREEHQSTLLSYHKTMDDYYQQKSAQKLKELKQQKWYTKISLAVMMGVATAALPVPVLIVPLVVVMVLVLSVPTSPG